MEAAGAFAEELTCAVCLQIYQDPVVLPCQHSFCLKCIDNVWGFSGVPGGVSCPQCRRQFSPRPCLEKNFTLRNIVEKYNQSQTTHAESAPVICEYCIENPSPAVKTCLKCETSFCSLHLKPHLTKETYNDHILIEPTADLTKRQCLDHKKILEFYCEEDEKCVCISCTVIGMHKSHTLLSLDQAEAKIKDQLKEKVANLHRVQENCATEQQDLKKSEAEIKTLTNELKGKLSKEFSEWRKQLEEDEKYALKLIDDEEHCILSRIRSDSESLRKKMEQIKLVDVEAQKQLQMDRLSFIQDSKQFLSRISHLDNTMTPTAILTKPAVADPFITMAQSDSDAWDPAHNLFAQRISRKDKRTMIQRYRDTRDPMCNLNVAPFNRKGNWYADTQASMNNPSIDRKGNRAIGTQNINLNLTSVHQFIVERMKTYQMYQSAISASLTDTQINKPQAVERSSRERQEFPFVRQPTYNYSD